jgi:hypothetical protein
MTSGSNTGSGMPRARAAAGERGPQADTLRGPAERTNTTAKVLGLIASLGALALVVSVTGCAGDHYPQSTEPQIEDSRTAERVREALAAGTDYKYDGVKVLVSNGVVQLTGVVKTTAQKDTAEEIARRGAGVKSVENHLTVKE